MVVSVYNYALKDYSKPVIILKLSHFDSFKVNKKKKMIKNKIIKDDESEGTILSNQTNKIN